MGFAGFCVHEQRVFLNNLFGYCFNFLITCFLITSSHSWAARTPTWGCPYVFLALLPTLWSELGDGWKRWVWSRLVSLPQTQAVVQHWALSMPLAGDTAAAGAICSVNNCRANLQITFCLQTPLLPQMNLSTFAGQDVVVQDPGTVKGFNPNIWESQEARWILTGGTVVQSLCMVSSSEIFLVIRVHWVLWSRNCIKIPEV